jgi:hypothetical protein
MEESAWMWMGLLRYRFVFTRWLTPATNRQDR